MRSVIKAERQQDILNMLREESFITTANLAKATFSSIATIRRDLLAMEALGLVVRNHGGAMLPPEATTPAPMDFRKGDHRTEKQKLCAAAAKLVKEHQTIFLDESTTLLPMAKYLVNFKRLVVVTNSLELVSALKESKLEVYCTGGKATQGEYLNGYFTQNFISNFNFDVCFFSSAGITSDGRIMDKNEYKSGVVGAMLKASKSKFYLCDESKIDKRCQLVVANADDVTQIITTAPKGRFKLPNEKVVCVGDTYV